MAFTADLIGTSSPFFIIEKGGLRLKNDSGNLQLRTNDDSDFAELTLALLNITGDSIVLNSDAAGSGDDWSITLTRPSSGMAASYTLTFPTTDGSPSQVLSTDGSGNLSWVSIAGGEDNLKTDTTTIAFNASSPVSAFTLPANAVVDRVLLIVDTQFDGTPTLTVGTAGDTAKYMGANQNDLTAAAGNRFETHPTSSANGSTEAIIVTYSQGSATAGSARVIVHYSIPD